MYVDPFLCVGLGILLFVLLIINVYTLAYWVHPDDSNESYVARAVIVLGLQLSAMSVLMLPIDIANNGGNPACSGGAHTSAYCGGIDMASIWEFLFCTICIFVLGVIPCVTTFYDSNDADILNEGDKPVTTLSRLCSACMSTAVLVFFFVFILVMLFLFYNSTYIPVRQIAVSFEDLVDENYEIEASSLADNSFLSLLVPSAQFNLHTQTSESSLSFSVNFSVYLVALFGWVGWWFFAVFSGIGLTSIPFDLFSGYIWRPKLLGNDELAIKEFDLQDRTSELLEISTLLKRERAVFRDGGAVTSTEKRKRMFSDRLEVNRLNQMVFILERDVEELQACKTAKVGYNPLFPYFKLIGGICTGTLSIFWLLHIVLYILSSPPVSSFLNSYFTSFDSWFPMFGTVSYALFSLYLLMCTVSGCFKFGVNLMFVKIHPMKPHGTYISSLLFNIAIVLLCTIPTVQFCTEAFADYSHNTDIFMLLGVQVQSLNFFEVFFVHHVFVWIIVLSSCSTFLYSLWRPRGLPGSTEDFKMQLRSRNAGGAKENTKSKKNSETRKGGNAKNKTKTTGKQTKSTPTTRGDESEGDTKPKKKKKEKGAKRKKTEEDTI